MIEWRFPPLMMKEGDVIEAEVEGDWSVEDELA